MRFKKYFALSSLVVLVISAGWLLSRIIVDQDESQLETPIEMKGPAISSQGQLATSSDTESAIEDFSSSEMAWPTTVDLREELKPPEYWESQYDLWLAGKKNMDEKDSVISRANSERLVDAALNMAETGDIQTINTRNFSDDSHFGPLFDSIDITDCCATGANVPPDPDLAVGPNHVVAAVNVAFEIYDKAGNVLVPATTFPALWNGVPECSSNVFDPNALYDEEADRFILGIDGSGTSYCLAVSQTSDPTGVWWRYRFNTVSTNYIFDYPQAGVGLDAIFMGANIFDEVTGLFYEARVWAFEKWAIYNGLQAAQRSHRVERPSVIPPLDDTPQPAHLHGFNQGTWPESGPHYILTETDFNGATYSVFSWENPFQENSFRYVGTFNLNTAIGSPAGHPIDVPQAGAGVLMANDWRLQDAEYRNGYIWTTQTIACNPGNGTVNCIRWAQIDPGDPSVVQAGIIGSDGTHRFYGDIGANHCNDMAVGYTVSAADQFASTWIANRQSNLAPGLIDSETLLKAGEMSYTAFDDAPYRWGDYTGMTNDPNGRDFWYMGQYSKNTQYEFGRWGTYIACFTPPSCYPPAGESASAVSDGVANISSEFSYFLPIVANTPYEPCGFVAD